jgi:hypothetical protein
MYVAKQLADLYLGWVVLQHWILLRLLKFEISVDSTFPFAFNAPPSTDLT